MGIKKIVLVLMLSLVFFGCTGKTEMSPEVKNQLTKITLDQNVTMPEQIMFLTRGDALAIGVGGALGGLMADSDKSDEEKFKRFLDENNISFETIIKDEYSLALKSKPYYYQKMSTESNTQHKFKITVNMYGLMYHHNIFSGDYKPSANIKFELIDKNNKVVWSETEYVSSHTEETSRMPLDDYFKNPENMKKALHSVAKVVSKLIVEKLP